MGSSRPTVVIAGLGDTGVMIAARLSRRFRVIAITTRPALVSGQELGFRLTDPARWRRTYLVPITRFRRLDGVEVVHGRVSSVSFDDALVEVEGADGSPRSIAYDAFVIATGVTNGFWRHDRVESMTAIDASMREIESELSRAATIAVVGGGATGVSVADNLARARTRDGRGGDRGSGGRAGVHLFHSGAEPLPGFHPDARSWIARRLVDDGVIVHADHRAIAPASGTDSLTTAPIEFSSGQPPFAADVVLWAVGAVRPHSTFLPAEVLDDEGFVRVDDELRVRDASGARVGGAVFAVGDVAATDPLRSSARNWGHRVIVANVTDALLGRGRVRRFRAAPHRWGSILGLQPEGLTVIAANGRRTRIPRVIADRVLLGPFVQRFLYGGLRRSRRS